MKVSSAPAQPSALDTWLQESDNPDTVAIEVARGGREAAATPHGSPSSRDSAEGLLGLDVWGGDPSARHTLPAGGVPVPVPDAAAAGAAQLWATHIFAPLV